MSHHEHSPSRPIARTAAAMAFAFAFTLPLHAQDAGANQDPAGGTAQDSGFPKELIAVGDGKEPLTIELGMSWQEAADLAEDMHPKVKRKRDEFLSMLRRELGGKTRLELDSFFLGKYPVTNKQYLAYVKDAGARFPYHWWYDGERKDYDARFEEVRKAESPYIYWEQNWRELPYSIPKGDEDKPVGFVSWKDAVGYAAWAGCRLPLEKEWVYAATGGDGEKQFLWGKEWDESKMKIPGRDKKLQPVGHWGERFAGPFGHEELNMQVWEWLGDPIPQPFGDFKDWREDLEKLKRHRIAEGVEFGDPRFEAQYRLMKGGTFMQTDGEREARLLTRVPVHNQNYAAALGFRIAKSFRPAIDHARAALTLNYVWSFFGGERRPDFDDHIGAERYEMSEDGRVIKKYHAVSLIPVSHHAEDEKPRLNDAKEMSRSTPIVVATLATTDKLAQPAVEQGYHTLCYRQSGLPKELETALKRAQGDLKKADKARKAAEKGGKEFQDPTAEADWRGPLKRFGITDEEAMDQGSSIKVMRLNPGNLEIPVDQTIYAVRGPNGDYASWFEARAMEAESGYKPGSATIEIGKPKKGEGELMTFEIGVPQYNDSRGKVWKFEVEIVLPKEAAGGSAWRTPAPMR